MYSQNEPKAAMPSHSQQQKHFHIDTKILNTDQQTQTLLSMFHPTKTPTDFQLLYRASENDFNAWKFKQKCSDISHTVLLVKTEYNKIVGGYTPLKWKKVSNDDLGWEDQCDKSGESFVFSISNNHKLTLQSPKKNEAIGHYNLFGPTFCNAICIESESNKKKKSHELWNEAQSYRHPEYKGKDKESWGKFCGSSDGRFLTEQWEVHRVIFKE